MAVSIRDAVPKRSRVAVVVAGGLVGAGVRATVAALLTWTPGAWPVSTLVVNLVGAALVAAFVARRRRSVSPWWSLDFWAIGVLGSLTTFSGLSLETVQLIDAGRTLTAAGYALLSPLLGLSVAWMAVRTLGRR